MGRLYVIRRTRDLAEGCDAVAVVGKGGHATVFVREGLTARREKEGARQAYRQAVAQSAQRHRVALLPPLIPALLFLRKLKPTALVLVSAATATGIAVAVAGLFHVMPRAHAGHAAEPPQAGAPFTSLGPPMSTHQPHGRLVPVSRPGRAGGPPRGHRPSPGEPEGPSPEGSPRVPASTSPGPPTRQPSPTPSSPSPRPDPSPTCLEVGPLGVCLPASLGL